MSCSVAMPVRTPELRSSLWTCDRCATFVTVHSLAELMVVWCPVCESEKMRPCGTFADVLESMDQPSSGNWC